jgi:hypothetical protein
MFYKETRYVEAVISPDELLRLPDVYIQFGPLKTSTQELASHGWKLRMYQSTPLLIKQTRPKISLTPGNNRQHGFRWKLRARMPYVKEDEILKDLSNDQGFMEFSLTKFETKTIGSNEQSVLIESLKRQLASSERIIKDMTNDDSEVNELRALIKSYEDDPFVLLKQWTDNKIKTMDFTTKVLPVVEPEPDNIIDFVEKLKSIYEEVDSVHSADSKKKATTGR